MQKNCMDNFLKFCRTTTVTQNRTMRMEDLEARPGSPSIMVVEQTNISQPLPPIERGENKRKSE